jgi:hypothetical protein
MSHPEGRTLERFQYRQGQALRSEDFRALHGGAEQRRWWHNRALHAAYGVRDGFGTQAMPPIGPTTAIQVEPGIAYDAFGRELILERREVIRLPDGLPPQTLMLTLGIRYRAPRNDRLRDAICWSESGSIAGGTVELFWKDSDRFVPSDGVSLGEVTATLNLLNNAHFFARNPGFRPVVSRAETRPILSTGATIPGNTPWQLLGPAQFAIGVETRIDTSAAGFTDRPVYFAWLQGPIFDPKTGELVLAWLPSLADESVTGFTFRLVMRLPPRQLLAMVAAPSGRFRFVDPEDFPLYAREHGLYVNWIGCQCSCGSSHS